MALAKITQVSGTGVYVPGSDIDTDRIIPARFMKCVTFDGLGEYAFYDVRFDKDGKPTGHPLDDPRFKGANILLSGTNFGCGSSREHAPWALEDYGFRVLIGPSFADIFFNNSFKNGLLPIKLDAAEVDELFRQCEASEGYRLKVDLAAQTITRPDGKSIAFDIDPFRKECLLNGWDDIGLTLRHADKIRAFEDQRRAEHPYYFA